MVNNTIVIKYITVDGYQDNITVAYSSNVKSFYHVFEYSGSKYIYLPSLRFIIDSILVGDSDSLRYSNDWLNIFSLVRDVNDNSVDYYSIIASTYDAIPIVNKMIDVTALNDIGISEVPSHFPLYRFVADNQVKYDSNKRMWYFSNEAVMDEASDIIHLHDLEARPDAIVDYIINNSDKKFICHNSYYLALLRLADAEDVILICDSGSSSDFIREAAEGEYQASSNVSDIAIYLDTHKLTDEDRQLYIIENYANNPEIIKVELAANLFQYLLIKYKSVDKIPIRLLDKLSPQLTSLDLMLSSMIPYLKYAGDTFTYSPLGPLLADPDMEVFGNPNDHGFDDYDPFHLISSYLDNMSDKNKGFVYESRADIISSDECMSSVVNMRLIDMSCFYQWSIEQE